MKTAKKNSSRIVIIGAGLVGAAMALRLSQAQLPFVILEKNWQALRDCAHDHRPLSLTYHSYLLLNEMGLWEELAPFACPIKSVHVSEQHRFGRVLMQASDINLDALGFVVPYGKLQSLLIEKIDSNNGIAIDSIQKITWKNNHIVIDYQNNHIESELLIAADGTHSQTRKLLNIATIHEEHNDIARIFDVTLAHAHQHRAFERFTKQGVLALLPLFEENKMRLVWSHNASKSIDESFIADAFRNRLAFKTIEKTAEFPLKTVIAETQITQHAVLVGNAAHTIYPVAAQGFNLGFKAAAQLVSILSQHRDNNLGEKNILQEYASNVHAYQQKIIGFTTRLSPLFEITLPFAGCVRGLSMMSLDLIFPMKKAFTKTGMGLYD